MNYGKEFTKGILKENPTLVGLLGMCPTLAVTTAAYRELSAAERDSGAGKTPLLYRNHCFVRNGHSVSGARLCAGVVYQSGSISGTDYCKLYHSGTGGNVRLQE